MDPSLYNTRRGGLSLTQLMEELEEAAIDKPIDIFTVPPEEDYNTECDSDASDDELEGNLNHLGPKMLLSECEYHIKDDDDDADEDIIELETQNELQNINSSFTSSDEEPLSKYMRRNNPGTSKYSENFETETKIGKGKNKKNKNTKSLQSNNPSTSKSSQNLETDAKKGKGTRKNTATKKKEKISPISWKKSQPSFNINVGYIEKPVSTEANSAQTPIEFFELFFSPDLLVMLLNETNLYSSQKNINLNMTMDEMYVFLGGMLLSGYAKYPNKRWFWSGRDDVPVILCNSMRLNRFEQILRHFHVNDNDGLDRDDRLYKLRPLITHLNTKFQYHCGLEENFSIDESMIPYYGRHYAKQYIKGKPIRFGFKNWALCTSTGYMVAFDIYTGKSNEERRFGLGGDTVLSLIKAANIPPNQGYKFYFDNYFSSVNLFLHLAESGYCATGTIQDGRTSSCPLKGKSEMDKQDRGSYDYRSDNANQICLVKWKDNKVVTCVTTFDSMVEGKCSRCSRENKSIIYVKQPQLFAKYNSFMGGVDKMDQMVAVCRTRMRQRKWWWPIFYYLLDVAITNAWLLMRKLQPNNKDCSSLLIFRSHIALSFLTTYGKASTRGRRAPNPLDDIRYDGREHWPEYVNTERLCKYCGGKSKFICSKSKIMF